MDGAAASCAARDPDRPKVRHGFLTGRMRLRDKTGPPGPKLFLSLELPVSQQPLQDFTAQLKADMAAAKCPEPAWHTRAPRTPIPSVLRDADHVFVRHGATRIPLTRPYNGPFRVVSKEGKFFTVKMGTKEQAISVDQWKPAFGFADPAPAIFRPQRKETIITARGQGVKTTLDPKAEVSVPAAVESRSGCVIKPPLRLNL